MNENLWLSEVSVCLPIHNEASRLAYCLSKLIRFPADEVICLFDRCTDSSEKIVARWVRKNKLDATFHYKDWNKWRNPIAENLEFLSSLAKGDLIYFINADHIVDINNFKPENWIDADVLSFHTEYVPISLHHIYENALIRVHDWLNPRSQNGLGAFRKSLWEKVHFEDTASPSNNFIKRAKEKGFRHKFVGNVKNYHYHPTLPNYTVLSSKARIDMQYPWHRVLLHSIVHLNPKIFATYLGLK